ncbi:Esterase, PHB depolymerase [Bosea sp. LC85]|uniref:extracellular catalytic domain type 1 short-chain-length polyhydroxyalkanoate depolymerase n=1 Tax=Bosea sp. LC85 TaxID=1502851 RepID=UPI0004E43CB9|nr:PHB depolymerase family esterase [Bosea sp. LC85]KFC64698.1 Esterase, PHB depolymerase [Bosea sp. LC85]
MTMHIRSAIGEAMTRLRNADVAGATAAIQQALAGRPDQAPQRPGTVEGDRAGSKAHARRGLGDILQSLRTERARFAEQPGTARHQPAPADEDGRFRSRSFRNAAGSLAYKLYVPADHAGRELALVVMLHGCTQDPDDFARGTRMNRLADEFGIVVAYPHQPGSANAQGCWNWFDPRHQRRGAGEPAVLAGLAQELAAEFGIDRERVFVAGLSAGGAMADVLSSTYPEVFSAAGIHSGLPHGAATDVMSAFAAMKGNAKATAPAKANGTRQIIFHGTADATVHPSNGETLFARARARDDALAELMTNAVVNGRHVTRTLVGPAHGPAITEYWLVKGAGHAWSGGDRTGSYTDASGPDASREMIRFFLEN